MRRERRRRGRALAAILASLALAAGVYVVVQHFRRALVGSGCQVGTGTAAISLGSGQAAIAATIAGVAHQRAMPAQAVVIAYATAMQESHLRNLSYGDLDSVGIFQQRPSQGWGPRQDLENPVYATTKFFQALAAVPGYLNMPVYQAAQEVQRSADGHAYQRYQQFAVSLSAAFTGASAHDVWCWSQTAQPASARLSAAGQALTTAFGPLAAHRTAPRGGLADLLVPASSARLGWAVAAWLVTHASGYALHQVRYDGLSWNASAGQAGWTVSPAAGDASEVQAD